MTDAPDKIWIDPDIDDHFSPARPDWDGGQWYVEKYKGPKSTPYLRATPKRLAAEDMHEALWKIYRRDCYDASAEALAALLKAEGRGMTDLPQNPPNRDTLEERVARAIRNEALEEAAREVDVRTHLAVGDEWDKGYARAAKNIAASIRAMKETDDD